MAERLSSSRLGESNEGGGRGGMFLGQSGTFDRTAIPTDEKSMVLRIPIPPDADGRPCYDRDLLWPHVREGIKAAHEAKVCANLRERDHLLTLCHDDLAARRDVEQLCAKDPVYWINHFVWVIDPRLGEKATKDPFVLYETQEQAARFFVDEFLASESMLWLVEKSRAWGATWLFAAALATWGFLYRQNWNVLLGAPNQPDVDKGGAEADHNSIFGKIRFLLKNLPPWQVPDRLLTDVKFNKNYLIKHPARDNALHGRQYCGNWGRSLRYLWTFSDEAAHSAKFHDASANFDNTSNRNLVLSTHKGGGTEFARMVNEARENRSFDVVLHTRHWPENPSLTIADYWGWRRRQGWAKVAQERDIDQFGSVGSAVFQDFSPAVNVVSARNEVKAEDGTVLVEAREALDYDPELPLGLLADPGMGDAFALIWLQPDDSTHELRIVDFLQYEEKDSLFFVPFLTGYIPEETTARRPWREVHEYSAEEMQFIERHARWGALNQELCFGDAYGQSKSTRMTTGRTIYETWTEYGVPLLHPCKVTNKEEAVARAAASIGRLRIAGRLLTQRMGGRHQPTIVECFKGYAWVQRESPNGLPLARVPIHNRLSHAMDAYQFWFFYNDAVDSSVTALAPPHLRDAAREGKAAFIRGPRVKLAQAQDSYEVYDDGICGG